MEILDILKNAGDSIYLEDLAFFETELATGEYAESYIAACREELALVRKRLCGEEYEAAPPQPQKRELPKGQTNTLPVMDIQTVAPQAALPVVAAMSPEEMLLSDMKAMRESSCCKSQLKEYLQAHTEIDAAFVDRHYSFFLPGELDVITSVRQLGEDFLEKYFAALNKGKIARYQCFSESFYMKHYAQLDASVVLIHGKNEWRKKGKRSKQLDVFLRLKGVRL